MNKRALRLVLPVLSFVNFAILAAAYRLVTLPREGGWLMYSIACAPFLLGAPLAVLMLWSLVRRRWLMVALNALVGLLFAFTLLGFNIPRHSSPAATGPTLRVMTYNIHGMEIDAGKIIKLVTDLDPQVLCVQEITNEGRASDTFAQLHLLLPGRWYTYRFADVATFSRYPIVHQEQYNLPLRVGRGVIETTISAPGGRLTLVHTHLSGSVMGQASGIRARMGSATQVLNTQVRAVMDIASRAPGPVIIAGDCNMPPLSSPYRRLSSRYKDAFKAAGFGFGHTYKAGRPFQRIDYLFVSPSVGVKRCFVAKSRASDHRPVVADLVLGR